MKIRKNTPKSILLIGASLILLSGIVSLVISIPNGAIYNDVDPYGIFGHIGIVNGVAAMVIGGFLLWLSRRKYLTPIRTILAGILAMVLGHTGAIAGALLVGTTGLILCYISGFWFIVLGIKRLVNRKQSKSNIKTTLG